MPIPIAAACAATLAALYVLVVRLHHGTRGTPDGAWYARMVARERVPTPYQRRWLVPTAARLFPWTWMAYGALLASAALLALLTGSVASAALFVGLPGLVFFSATCPMLVDPIAFALALGAVYARTRGQGGVAIALVLLAGASKETAPVFAAAWSLDPTMLVGLLAVRWWGGSPLPDYPVGLRATVAFMRARHDPLDWRRYVAPWGALAVLFPMALSGASLREALPSLLSLGLGYGQLLVATDTSRLYQWAAPAVIGLVCRDPPSWAPALYVLHLANPHRHVG